MSKALGQTPMNCRVSSEALRSLDLTRYKSFADVDAVLAAKVSGESSNWQPPVLPQHQDMIDSSISRLFGNVPMVHLTRLLLP
jgi:hypothetical protein